MTESALEREIEALLSVEPAPDFRARVRERIATEPAPNVPSLRWTLATAIIVAAVVLGAIVLRTPSHPFSVSPRTTEHELRTTIEARPIEIATDEALPRIIEAGAAARYRPSSSTAPSGQSSADMRSPFEVIVDASEAAAWRRLLHAVGSGDIDLSRIARGDEPKPLPVVEDFVLPPIVIESLTPAVHEQGVHP